MEANCYSCKYRKKYFGFGYCVKTADKLALLCEYLRNPERFEAADLKHNYTEKPTPSQKEKIQAVRNAPFEPGNCEKCLGHILHLNYCSIFGRNAMVLNVGIFQIMKTKHCRRNII